VAAPVSGLTIRVDWFDGPPGFSFVMPGVALSGLTTEGYSTGDHLWHITHVSDGREYSGRGESRVLAYLDLIANRMDEGPIVKGNQ
jgi:hypothetical protein